VNLCEYLMFVPITITLVKLFISRKVHNQLFLILVGWSLEPTFVFAIDRCTVYTGYVIKDFLHIGTLFKVRFIGVPFISVRFISVRFISVRFRQSSNIVLAWSILLSKLCIKR